MVGVSFQQLIIYAFVVSISTIVPCFIRADFLTARCIRLSNIHIFMMPVHFRRYHNYINEAGSFQNAHFDQPFDGTLA